MKQHVLLPLIHLLDRSQDIHRIAILFRRLDQRLYVFREARTTIATAWIQELTPDTAV